MQMHALNLRKLSKLTNGHHQSESFYEAERTKRMIPQRWSPTIPLPRFLKHLSENDISIVLLNLDGSQ
jgi:hypothetical protein